MKHIIALFAVLLAFCGLAQAQTQTEPIEIVKKSGFTYYYLNGEHKSIKELKTVMMSDPIAYVDIYMARRYDLAAKITGYTGASFLGSFLLYNFSKAMFQYKPTETLQTLSYVVFGLGLGLSVDGIIYSIVAGHKAKKAIGIYNSRVQPTTFWDSHDLKVGFTGNGVGVAFCF